MWVAASQGKVRAERSPVGPLRFFIPLCGVQLGSTLGNYVAIYTFTVAQLPGGLPRYGFSVGKNRGLYGVAASQVKDPGLSLGSLSS
jgi:hypothetical protein